MTYKYSRGDRKVGDLQFEDDTNTEIDFEAASFLDFTEKDPFSEGNF